MLQWMGGSRRKVSASRKSTHNRQKQYFEQRKRQQQTPGQVAQENNNEGRNKRAHYQEEPRSLDILGLINFTSVSQQDHPSHRNASEPWTISPNKFSSSFNSQNVPAAHRSGTLDGRKILESLNEVDSKNSDARVNQKELAQNDVSVLDLLGDDEPRNNSEGRSLPEAHVAFSVEGLGKVSIGTPVHSPRLHGRGFPSTPKASRRIQSLKHRKSIPFGLRLEQTSLVHGLKISQDGSPSKSTCNPNDIFDDLINTENGKFIFSCMSPDAYDNLTENFHDEEETSHSHKKTNWNESFDNLDEHFLDEMEYDTTWKNNSFHSERYPPFPSKAKKSETYDMRFGDAFSECSRSVFGTPQRSKVPAPSSPCLNQLRAGKDTYDWDSTFGPPAWSFLATEDSQDSMSLLSEESCSSTAVREERSYRFRRSMPAHHRAGYCSKYSSNGTDTGLFGSKFMPEDDLFSEPKVGLSVRSIHEDDIFRDPLGTENHFPCSYKPGELKKDARFPDSSGRQKGRVDNVMDLRDTESVEKKSSSSVNGGTAVVSDCNSNCSGREESKGENPEPGGLQHIAEAAPLAMGDAPTQPPIFRDHSGSDSPIASRMKNEDLLKESLGAANNPRSMEGGKEKASYQVMLESYVLQLLCVQKVLLEASEKDIKKV